jgi:hypothetical protein
LYIIYEEPEDAAKLSASAVKPALVSNAIELLIVSQTITIAPPPPAPPLFPVPPVIAGAPTP